MTTIEHFENTVESAHTFLVRILIVRNTDIERIAAKMGRKRRFESREGGEIMLRTFIDPV